MNYLFLFVLVFSVTTMGFAQGSQPSSPLYSGRSQIKTFDSGPQEVSNYRVLYFSLEGEFFDLKAYTDLIGRERFENIVIPHVSVGELWKKYHYIGVAYKEVAGLISTNSSYFLTFLIRDINKPTLEIFYDKQLNYSYHDEMGEVILDDPGADIRLEYYTKDDKIQLSTAHSFKNKEVNGIVYSDTVVLKFFNTDDHANLLSWVSRKRTTLKFGLSAEFGLGGSGYHYYDYMSNDNGVQSTISYEYGYRTGHFGLEPSVSVSSVYLSAGLFYELRQPRDGLYEVDRSDFQFFDNGVSKIFPKRRSIVYFGAGYQFDLSTKLKIIPYVKYGFTKFTGFAAEEFNQILRNGRSLMPGIRLDIALNHGQRFYLNVFGNFDRYEMNDPLKFIDPGSGLPVYHEPSNQKHYQINVALGYYLNIFSKLSRH